MFALIDCNNFYVSCERIFNPTIHRKPVVVLSNNDGCVIARSNDIKPYIPMGAPIFKYRHIIRQHQVQVYSTNFALYGDISSRVMRTIQRYAPDIEIYSIDEAFITIKPADKTVSIYAYAKAIQQAILNHIHIPTSIGIAPTKVLAKVANKIAKKYQTQTGGVYTIDTEEKKIKALRWLPVGDIWGIGRKTSKKLHAIGVTTAHRYTQLTAQYVKQHFTIVGMNIQQELQGVSILPLEKQRYRHSIMCSRSFPKELTTKPALEQHISTFSTICGKKLREQHTCCLEMKVFVHTNRFKQHQPQYYNCTTIQLPYPIQSDMTLSAYALSGLRTIYSPHYAYKRAGVLLSSIIPTRHVQQELFMHENPKHRAVTQAVDHINTRYHNGIMLAHQHIPSSQVMRPQHKSNRYTTVWSELLTVQ